MSAIDHPAHYSQNPAGIECIDVVELMTFNRGNAVKYLWRAGLKGSRVEDLRKARWYVEREKCGCVDVLAPDRLAVLLQKASAGFENPLVGSAILHIADGVWPMALNCIDALIAECEKDDLTVTQ